MRIQRVAVIFDNQVRPETTGTYCLRALQELVTATHVLPANAARIPPDAYDLYLNVDDGFDYHLPPNLHPSVWWAVDTHLSFERCLAKAHDFDVVFAAQRDGAFRLCDEGISTRWLPLACDAGIHRPHAVPKEWDFCFVGNLFPGPRTELLELLQRRLPRCFIGQRYFDDMARTYSASRLVFNCSLENDINMRVFEAVACGSLLLTNDLAVNGQAELFRDGVHLATYGDTDEMLDKARYYLDRDELRERIAAAGRAEAVARHTYRHRMETLLLLAEAERSLAAITVAANFSPAAAEEEIRPDVVKVPASTADPSAQPASEVSTLVDPGYFDFARPELLTLVPTSARTVLDVGCGSGRLGEALKARQTATVFGVEYVEAAAALARTRLDRVFAGNIETLALPFEPASLDAVICGDVLEHLREPGQLLRRLRGWLRPDGRLIASIPNVRHHTVVRGLLSGNWTYEMAGLLDRTHLHFYTKHNVLQLMTESGFQVEHLDVVPGPGYAEWEQQGRPGAVHVGSLHLDGLSSAEAEEFFVYQYLVTARPIQGSVASPDTSSRRKETEVQTPAASANCVRRLRIMYLGDFGSSWRHETQTALALGRLGHTVHRFQEHLLSSNQVLRELDSGRYDCLLFYKGRIGARSIEERFSPDGAAIAEVLQRSRVPGYTWYVDRALGFDYDVSREAWMRRVAPLCRVAFVADGPLLATDWARWHLLREPVPGDVTQKLYVPKSEKHDVAFIGQLYGERAQEVAAVEAAFDLQFIQGVYGSDLSAALRRYRVILGPRYPCVPGFWGNRLYVVLGHGGFFLAPEVAGMREEGFIAGEHYAPLGPDAVADVQNWLARPEERERIAQAGRELVLSRFTYDHAVAELARVIAETLP